MPLISQQIKNLVHGISQQPDVLRHPEQLEAQINGYCTESAGLQKRPGTIHVKKIATRQNKNINPYVHLINRDENEKYLLMLDGENINVFDLDGNPKTVNYQDDVKDYIFSSAPRDTLRCLTIADYTFIVNNLRTTKLSNAPTVDIFATQGALVNIKSGQYGRTYKISINKQEIASYQTPNGSDSSHSAYIATDHIAQTLANQIVPKGYSVKTGSSWLYIYKTEDTTMQVQEYRAPKYSLTEQSNRLNALREYMPGFNGYSQILDGWYIQIKNPNVAQAAEIERCRSEGNVWTIQYEYKEYYSSRGNKIKEHIHRLIPNPHYVTVTVPSDKNHIEEVEVYDGFNNQAAVGILKSVQKFTNLPSSAPDGFTVKVAGETGSNADDYYVCYNLKEGIWKETVKPGLNCALDNSSMPHILVREADGTFTFKKASWSERSVGDDDSCPLPSFIDQPINDIFFFRNRLGFIAGENVILSRSADFFNFFITSAIELQDTDPIDLAVSDNKVATLHNATIFGEELLLFSSDAQFSLTADSILTPKTAKLTSATNFSSNIKAKPQASGRNVYFTAEKASHTLVKEYGTALDDTEDKDSEDITSHVPNYLPNTVYKIIPSTIENVLLFLTTGAKNCIYVYKYLFLGGSKQQSAWSHWEFKGDIIGADFIGSKLYIVIERENELYLEYISFSYNTLNFDDEPYHSFMDRKSTTYLPSSAFDPVKETTSISLKDLYNTTNDLNIDDTYFVLCAGGVLYEIKTTDKITLEGNLTCTPLIIGQSFSFQVEFSQLMLKSQTEAGTLSTTEGRLQLKYFWLTHNEAGSFDVIVKHFDKDEFKYRCTGRILGTKTSALNTLPFKQGEFKVPIQSKNTNCSIKVISNAPQPISLIGAGYSALYNRVTRQY